MCVCLQAGVIAVLYASVAFRVTGQGVGQGRGVHLHTSDHCGIEDVNMFGCERTFASCSKDALSSSSRRTEITATTRHTKDRSTLDQT